MSIRHAIPAAIVMLLAPVVQAEQQPITFARSGKTVSMALAIDDRPLQSVVLCVYGRVWTKPVAVKNGTARIDVPTVRVPTVFRITPAKDAKRTLGEVVVYPDGNVGWDKEIIVYAAGVPKWFDQWVMATGLPVIYFTDLGFKDPGRKPKDKRKVLVIGGKCAGKTFVDTLAVAKKHKINILVLDADWFGGKSGKVAIQPKQMAGELAAIRKQQWSKPIMFRSHRPPWPGIANRWTWIGSKDDSPLVEEVANPASSQKVVVSYVPWREQLGRCDVADLTLLNVLSAAAAPGRKLRWRMPEILYPSPKVLEETEKQRPVLTAASKAWARVFIEDIPSRIYVIDLRGGTSPPPEFRKTLERLEKRDGKAAPLLILGDDPLLDNWKLAKIDRKKRVSKRVGVLWLPDDTLPPPTKTQIRLMLKLTELGISLKPLEPGEMK